MLETEAKTKWCPFAHVRTYEGSSANRSLPGSTMDPKNDPMCIGSACMAWVNSPVNPDGPSGRCGMVPPTTRNTY